MTDTPLTFDQLGLGEKLLKGLKNLGYEHPSPIQEKSIQPMLEGRDILGQAQTGTGKTAAFALPILQNINVRQKSTQAMVLAPTRELAIQVAEAFQSYAHYMPGFNVLPIYGGQSYDGQIRALKRGVQLVVGTPGRVMDHMRKGTLKLDKLEYLVLDEADEMLRMGFIDDVEWVMGQLPEKRQIALFSATMPPQIAKVANTYLNDPVQVKIKQTTATASTINQRYWPVSGLHKLDALTRILEAETFDAMIVFVRTKTATIELAEKLEARGYSASPLNGDISQNIRERTVERLKNGKIDILVATDVAARGLDVDRISHVLNYDIPYDAEAYVHRIGRTGRAGRKGEAILFVARREQRMLRTIERATSKTIEPMVLPSAKDINDQRVKRFKQNICDTVANEDISFFKELVESLQTENEYNTTDIAAALAYLSQGDQPLLLQDKPSTFNDSKYNERPEREHRSRGDRSDRPERPERSDRSRRSRSNDDNTPMEAYRLEVGSQDGVRAGNIVGAIANEGGIDSQFIRKLKINDDHSTVELPADMSKEVFQTLLKTRAGGKQLRLSLLSKKHNVSSEAAPKAKKPSYNSKKKRANSDDNAKPAFNKKKGPAKKDSGALTTKKPGAIKDKAKTGDKDKAPSKPKKRKPKADS